MDRTQFPLNVIPIKNALKMRYSIEPREKRYVKGYGILSFTRNLGTYSINVAKNLNNKYGENLADSAKKSATDAFKIANKRAVQKAAEATGDLISNKIVDKITSYSKTQQMNHAQMMLPMKYQKKIIYLHKKDKKLLMK